MQNKRFLKDISASGIQVVATQAANLIIFYLISKYISKEEFGFYNWATATSTTIITILSLGMDLVYVKRVASGFKEKITIELHFFHTLFTGIALITLSILLIMFFPNLLSGKSLFLLILISQVSFAVSNSVKLAINGLEKYTYLAYIAILVSTIKLILILILFFIGQFTIFKIIYAFTLTYLIEFLYSIFFIKKTHIGRIKPKLIIDEYKELIKESLPQLGTVILSTSSVRLDLIMMGLLATAIKTAEYSFALKIVQISQIPLLIISSILLTRFSKIFNSDKPLDLSTSNQLDEFLKIEMIIGILIPLATVSIWSEFFDTITDNKYGAVNALTYQIMVIGIPFHYATNFLWSMAFAQGQLKQILLITIISTSINVLSNLLLIYFWGGEGAALSDLISSIISFMLYLKITKQQTYRFKIKTPLIALFNGVLSTLVSMQFNLHYSLKLAVATSIFLILSYCTKQLSIKSLSTIKSL